MIKLMNRLKFDKKIIDKMIISKLNESNIQVYKNEAHSKALYPFVLYEYTQRNSENKGVFDLSVYIWSNENNIEVEKINNTIENLLADKLFFDEYYSYRFFIDDENDIELFENSIRSKLIKFEMIII